MTSDLSCVCVYACVIVRVCVCLCLFVCACACVCVCSDEDRHVALLLNQELNGTSRPRRNTRCPAGFVSVTDDKVLPPHVPGVRETGKRKLEVEKNLFAGSVGRDGSYHSEVSRRHAREEEDDSDASDTSMEESREHKRQCSAALEERAAKIALRDSRGSSRSSSPSDPTDGYELWDVPNNLPLEVQVANAAAKAKATNRPWTIKHTAKMHTIVKNARKLQNKK